MFTNHQSILLHTHIIPSGIHSYNIHERKFYNMDIVQINNDAIVYSYKGGLKISNCCDLIAIECNKPLVNLIFRDKTVGVCTSLSSVESKLPSYFVKISRQVLFNIHYVSELAYEDGSYWIYSEKGKKHKVSERREKSVQSAILLYKD